MDGVILGVKGFVHQHDGAVILDGDRRNAARWPSRRDNDLVRLNQVGAYRLIGDQINPVDAVCILLADQRINMRAGAVRRDRRNVAAQVVDVGEPVVRSLVAGRMLHSWVEVPLSIVMP